MSGFKYVVPALGGVDPGFTEPSFRHFLALDRRDRQSHAGTFHIAHTDVAGTDFSVTGVGFQPEALLIFDAITFAPPQFIDDEANMGIGMTDGTNQWAGHISCLDLQTATAPGVRNYDWRDDSVIANFIRAHFVSFDADGFTIHIDANRIPLTGADNYFVYLALKNNPTSNLHFACGTELSPASTGTQSITGLGFQPTAMFFASVMAAPGKLNGGESDTYVAYSMGGTDLVNGQYNVWTSYTQGDIYDDMLANSNSVITFGIDSQPSVPPFIAQETAKATVQSFDADGFTLDWSQTDQQGYYSWFAVDGPAEVQRWLFDVPDLSVNFITTADCPRALIFFMNHQGNDGSFDHLYTGGSGMSIGCCDQDNRQFLAGYDISSEGSFSVQRTVRELRSGVAFGSYKRVVGGVLTTMPNNETNTGIVTTKCRRDHLLRMHAGQ